MEDAEYLSIMVAGGGIFIYFITTVPENFMENKKCY
jgi:hypothetical protein